MNKIERLSATLVKLQSLKYVPAQQLADQFRISLRTVYRDIRILEEAGIPVVANMGVGYSLVEGYKLPPLMFSTEEAVTFMMAEKILELHSGGNSYELYRRGMDKVRAVLKAADRQILEDFDQHIHVIRSHTLPSSQPVNVLQPLLESIIRRKAVQIEYTANYNRETTKRRIEPVGIFYWAQNWYLLAWCRLRADYRTFHLDRIRHITTMDSAFEHKHQSVKSILDRLYSEKITHRVVLRLDKTALRDIGGSKFIYGLRSEWEEGDQIIQEYITYSLEYFGRWYLSFSDKANIEEPAELKEIVKGLIRRARI